MIFFILVPTLSVIIYRQTKTTDYPNVYYIIVKHKITSEATWNEHNCIQFYRTKESVFSFKEKQWLSNILKMFFWICQDD